MHRILDRKGWLLAGAVALPMLATGIYVDWFGPAWLVPWWRGVLYVLAAAVITGVLFDSYRRRRKRRE